jgi:hypothetical protein
MLKRPAILLIGFFFFFCGIEEYYYLPQKNNILVNDLYGAEIDFPPVPSEYYYAANYEIYYRIYISDYFTASITTTNEMSKISPSLASDYRYFEPITDPTNTSSITLTNTFKNRNYFKLELEGEKIDNVLSKDGGTLKISFPPTVGSYPSASFNDSTFRLLRSNDSSPEPDFYFRNTSDLRDYSKTNDIINRDIAGRSGTMSDAYVSMYIVLAGTDPVNFPPIYSKPTHISIFKLPA